MKKIFKKRTFKDDTLDKTHKTELFNYELLLIKPKESKEPKEAQTMLSSTSNSNKTHEKKQKQRQQTTNYNSRSTL